MIYLPEINQVYFSQTKKYLEEVLSCYYNKNYRAANVMLYSVLICDILLKLQELSDMYNDKTAKTILEEIKSTKECNTGSRSAWEKKLIEEIHKKTKLIDLEAYTHINHLYDDRNFSAHPALNDNYELICPSQETTIANIKNIIKDIFIKPPIFIKNIVDMLTEDLQEKKYVYENSEEKLKIFLDNKYYAHMDLGMKKNLFKTLWSFCFCKPKDPDCQNNLDINRKALKVLFYSFNSEAIKYVSENADLFTVATDNKCIHNLILFLSAISELYSPLNSDVKEHIDKAIKESGDDFFISWFVKGEEEHLKALKNNTELNVKKIDIDWGVQHYKECGLYSELLEFFIIHYGNSNSFDMADTRYTYIIRPFLKDFTRDQLELLINKIEDNNQLNSRRLARMSNQEIYDIAKCKLPSDYKYPPNFSYKLKQD